MKARREPLEVEITSGGKRIGALTAAEFMQSMNRPRAFLPALVTEFNAMKEREGEPERAAVKLMRRGSKVKRKKNPAEFKTKVKPLSAKESKGKWDYAVTVTRTADGAEMTELVSGGMATVDGYVAKMKKLLSDDAKREALILKGNPTMARKKKRTAKQIAATKKLVAFNKKRRSKKKTAARRKPTRKKTARRRATNPAKKSVRSGSVGRDYQIFKCQGNSVHFLALTTDGHIRWTLTRGDTVRWQSKAEAAKIARRLAKGRKLAGFGVGVVSRQSSALAIIAACKPGK